MSKIEKYKKNNKGERKCVPHLLKYSYSEDWDEAQYEWNLVVLTDTCPNSLYIIDSSNKMSYSNSYYPTSEDYNIYN